MKVIALCSNLEALENGGLKSPEICKKYPGAAWIPRFVKEAESEGYRVMTGREALMYFGDFSRVHVIQEELNFAGQALIQKGAKPTLVYCMESPIFAPYFYDRIPQIKEQFKYQMLFEGGSHHMYFPSFDPSDVKPLIPWGERRPLVMVASNKHYAQLEDHFNDSPAFHWAVAHQLHDVRYQAIQHFRNKGMLDLYGHSWGAFAHACQDKIQTTRNYKFAICFENGSYPGYITEKIIDCFVAGVVPIYMGAPDVKDFIPEACFFYAAKPGSNPEWDKFDENLPFLENQAESILYYGRKFLESEEGFQYSNDHFVKEVLSLVRSHE